MQVGDLVKCMHRYSGPHRCVQYDDACLVLSLDGDGDPKLYVIRTSLRVLDYKTRYVVISKVHNENR